MKHEHQETKESFIITVAAYLLMLVFLVAVLLFCATNSKAETLNGVCGVFSRNTATIAEAQQALEVANSVYAPLRKNLRCTWRTIRKFPDADFADLYNRTSNGVMMTTFGNMWGDRLNPRGTYDFVWVVLPELPRLPSTRGSSVLCHRKAEPEWRKNIVSYVAAGAPNSLTSLFAMHAGHFWGANNDETSGPNVMSHQQQAFVVSARSRREIRSCDRASAVNGYN